MAIRPTSVADPAFAGFDDIIDVRSPQEFAEDHLPGAINLPVLDDQERAQVGTIYKQSSPFDARKIGAALVAANAARHIAGALADRGGGWKALVYCWRGGQRSGSFATILGQIGWRVDRIEGGYKAWRKLVVDRVQNGPVAAPVVVLDGNTGSAKTAILQRLAARGAQCIDLEGMARHRGSLFGAMPGGQPSQKLFEGRLAAQLEGLDAARPVIVEAESSRIGDITIPKALWQAICAAPRIRLQVPVDARAAYSAHDYADLVADPDRLAEILASLAPLHPAERILAWQKMASSGAWQALAEGLMRDHYDPRYLKHRLRYAEREKAVVALNDLQDLDAATGQVEAALADLAR
ncbi:tRNA 2-selenouridine(34) synthase MnmH [Paracoccus sp. R12_1]|uniref:tRNA 2-selenouridine(34) synthase MnmH n=1 Tax=unclassified Paracoccus (in: a-proteobacteria) TaxID=2688777 RepID=UPI001ADB44F2|nr:MULTISPECIES: tRNA 2-selenouridine(34) synthase MnmH [unclassified Paracoccus (in: a-proteobacteria)]MBO9454855.1 tRNA 2-selenouridine(34) synthase MnmH [Paracoccus sp. R12_2]MBO9485457.1 tRNA 2-selenouridine(34) synthase MnmH [Paracoccus sp. R12_1]